MSLQAWYLSCLGVAVTCEVHQALDLVCLSMNLHAIRVSASTFPVPGPSTYWIRLART